MYGQVDGARFPIAKPPNAAAALRFIAVGRLDRDKNPLRVIDILAELKEAHDLNFEAIFVGAASAQQIELLRQRASERGIGERVTALGVRSDVPELIAASDILLSATLREGLPGAIIESAAGGLPSVVSAIPPNTEVATLLPSIITVPLESSDAVWCDVILDVLAQRSERLLPEAIRAWFEASPFALRSNEELDVLWS
jgi:glycosyltransferase involved in cell wall biosynthesis